MMAGFVAVYGAACLVKLRYFLYRDFDLAIFAQAAHGALRGSTFSSIRGMSWLGDHSSLVMFLIAPIYALAPSPATLLLIQVLALALGAIPVRRMARRAGADEAASLAFAAVYLLAPALGCSALFEFHPETLATSALLFAFDAMLEARTVRTLVFSTLALLCKEDVALPVFAMAVYAVCAVRPRPIPLAIGLVAAGAASLALSFVVIKPRLDTGHVDYARMYGHWGRSMGEVIAHALRDPIGVLRAMVSTPGDPGDTMVKRQYYLHMLLPWGFLSLLSPATLVALPIVIEHMLSYRSWQHSIAFQYTALVTPFVAAGAVLGWRNLMRWSRGRLAWMPWIAPALAIVAQWTFGPWDRAPWGRGAWFALPSYEHVRPTDEDRLLAPLRERLLARVPREGAVVAGFELLPRLANREQVHSFHHVVSGHYTFSDRPYPLPANVGAVIADIAGPDIMTYADMGTAGRLRALIADNGLHPVAAAGDLVLFTRDARDTIALCTVATPPPAGPKPILYDGGLEYLGSDSLAANAGAGSTLEVRTWWRRTAPIRRLHAVQLALFDEQGRARLMRMRALGGVIDPPHAWRQGDVVRETARVLLPSDLEPGVYRLFFRLSWRDEAHGGLSQPDDSALRALGGMVRLGAFRIEPAGS